MGDIIRINSVPASPKRSMILTRLGYKTSITILDEKNQAMLEEGIRLGRILCKPQAVYKKLRINEKNADSVVLENGMKFKSERLCKLLQDSTEVVLMASTVGNEVVENILHNIKNGDAAKGVILDSVASQTADAVLDWLMDFINRSLAREGKVLTKHRYSPGYGDLQLSYQKFFFEALELEKMGMELTQKYMLVPEKSVTAVAGVNIKGSEI